jgi:hypothetical protein
MRTEPDSVIVCDKCRKRSTESEESAIAEGWIIDSSTAASEDLYFCPDCMDAA